MKRIWSAALLLALVAPAFLAGAWVTWHASGRADEAGDTQGPLLGRPDAPDLQVGQAGNRPGLRHGARARLRGTTRLVATGSSLPPGALRVSPEKQQTIGVRVARVETSAVDRTIRTVGRVTVDENRVYRLVATVDGIVRELHPNAAGSFVRTGPGPPHLLQLGVPRGAAGVLLRPERPSTASQGDKSEPTEQTILTNAQLRSAVDTLRNLGMSDVADPRPRQDAPAGAGHRAALARRPATSCRGPSSPGSGSSVGPSSTGSPT